MFIRKEIKEALNCLEHSGLWSFWFGGALAMKPVKRRFLKKHWTYREANKVIKLNYFERKRLAKILKERK